MNKFFKNQKTRISTAVVFSLLSLSAIIVYGQSSNNWEPPRDNAPNNAGVFAPITPESTGQKKGGGLILNRSGISRTGLTVLGSVGVPGLECGKTSGNNKGPTGCVGIGLADPLEKLHLVGNFLINDLIKINGSSGRKDQVLTIKDNSSMKWSNIYKWVTLLSQGSVKVPPNERPPFLDGGRNHGPGLGPGKQTTPKPIIGRRPPGDPGRRGPAPSCAGGTASFDPNTPEKPRWQCASADDCPPDSYCDAGGGTSCECKKYPPEKKCEDYTGLGGDEVFIICPSRPGCPPDTKCEPDGLKCTCKKVSPPPGRGFKKQESNTALVETSSPGVLSDLDLISEAQAQVTCNFNLLKDVPHPPKCEDLTASGGGWKEYNMGCMEIDVGVLTWVRNCYKQ